MIKWSNEKYIDMGMGDTCYSNFLPSTMVEFKQNLYLYYFNGPSPSPKIKMKLNYISDAPVQEEYFLNKHFGLNTVRRHKEFKRYFACQDLQNTISACKLYTNWEFNPS